MDDLCGDDAEADARSALDAAGSGSDDGSGLSSASSLHAAAAPFHPSSVAGGPICADWRTTRWADGVAAAAAFETGVCQEALAEQARWSRDSTAAALTQQQHYTHHAAAFYGAPATRALCRVCAHALTRGLRVADRKQQRSGPPPQMVPRTPGTSPRGAAEDDVQARMRQLACQ